MGVITEKTFLPMLEAVLEPTGATYRIEYGKKHNRLHLTLDGKTQFVTISSSTSDRRALLNRLRDVKHVLRALAEETEQ